MLLLHPILRLPADVGEVELFLTHWPGLWISGPNPTTTPAGVPKTAKGHQHELVTLHVSTVSRPPRTMTKSTPKTHVGVKGNMTAKGADRVGLVLALTAMLAVALSGIALILWAAS